MPKPLAAGDAIEARYAGWNQDRYNGPRYSAILKHKRKVFSSLLKQCLPMYLEENVVVLFRMANINRELAINGGVMGNMNLFRMPFKN